MSQDTEALLKEIHQDLLRLNATQRRIAILKEIKHLQKTAEKMNAGPGSKLVEIVQKYTAQLERNMRRLSEKFEGDSNEPVSNS
jgi:hypothetical protein